MGNSAPPCCASSPCRVCYQNFDPVLIRPRSFPSCEKPGWQHIGMRAQRMHAARPTEYTSAYYHRRQETARRRVSGGTGGRSASAVCRSGGEARVPSWPAEWARTSLRRALLVDGKQRAAVLRIKPLSRLLPEFRPRPYPAPVFPKLREARLAAHRDEGAAHACCKAHRIHISLLSSPTGDSSPPCVGRHGGTQRIRCVSQWRRGASPILASRVGADLSSASFVS